MVSVQDLVLLMQASPVQVMEKVGSPQTGGALVGDSLEEEPLRWAPLPVLVGNNRVYGGGRCWLVITYQETAVRTRRGTVRG